MIKKISSLFLAIILISTLSLTAFAEQADVGVYVAPKTTTTTDATIPKDVKAVKSYTAEVGRSYKLPDNAKNIGDSYATSNSKVLTVDKTTGGFKTIANGVAYIVITNGTSKSYIHVTVGSGATTVSTNKPTTTQNPDGSTSITIKVNDGSGNHSGTTNGTTTTNTTNTNKTAKQQAEDYVAYLRNYAESQGMTWSIEAKEHGGFEPSADSNGKGVEEGLRNRVDRLKNDGVTHIYADISPDPNNSNNYYINIYR